MTSGRRPIAFPKSSVQLGQCSITTQESIHLSFQALSSVRCPPVPADAPRWGQIEPVQNQGPVFKARRDHQSAFRATCRSSTPAPGERLASWNAALDRHPLPSASMSRPQCGGLHLVFGATLGTAPQTSKNSIPRPMGMGHAPSPRGNLSAFMAEVAVQMASGWRLPNPVEAHGRLQTTRRRPPRTRARVPDPVKRAKSTNAVRAASLERLHAPGPIPQHWEHPT